MIYRHPKFKHAQTVGEGETVKRRLLEHAGWKVADPEVAGTPELVEPVPVTEAPKRRGRKRK